MEDIEHNSKFQSLRKIKIGIELLVILALCVIVFAFASYYDAFEKMVSFVHRYENFELDEIFIVALFLLFVLISVSFRQWRRARISQKALIQSNKKLQKALSEIKQLRGIIPICASCKKVRDDSGFWQQVEVYVRDHTDAEFSHGLCPECTEKLYPDFYLRNKDKLNKNK